MAIINVIFNLFIKLFTYIGDKAIYVSCQSWYDEPQVPKELTDLYDKEK